MMIDAEAFRDFEKAGWEERAVNYDRFFTAVSDHNITPLLDAAKVHAGSRILDVACGAGNLAAGAAKRGAFVIGTDIAEEVVELARSRHPDVEFRRADAEHLPFADSQFDAVVANLLVPHLPHPEAGIKELTRVLKPAGWLAVSMWGLPSRSRLTGIIMEAVAAVGAPPPKAVPPGPPTFRYSDDDELAELLRSVGLAKVTTNRVEFSYPISSSEELWLAWTEGTVRTASLVRAQTDDVQAKIRAAFDRLLDAYTTKAGFSVPVSFLIASGTVGT